MLRRRIRASSESMVAFPAIKAACWSWRSELIRLSVVRGGWWMIVVVVAVVVVAVIGLLRGSPLPALVVVVVLVGVGGRRPP